MRTAAILPVKSFSQAKQRLGASVADPLRLDLAKAMVGDVLEVLTSAPELALTIVVTREPLAIEIARARGAAVVLDTAEAGQSAAVALGIERAVAERIERILCVPGDCPALDPSELAELLAAPVRGVEAAGEVAIVPDRHGTGTNGLLLRPPTAIAPSFGPGSCERHRELAAAAGVPCRIERPSSLLLDIDTGADLAELRGRLSGERFHAPRTRRVLGMDGRQAWRASPSAA